MSGIEGVTARAAILAILWYKRFDQTADEEAQLMEQKQIRRLMVLNRQKRLTGIVSLGDLAVDTKDQKLAGEVLERVSEPAQPER